MDRPVFFSYSFLYCGDNDRIINLYLPVIATIKKKREKGNAGTLRVHPAFLFSLHSLWHTHTSLIVCVCVHRSVKRKGVHRTYNLGDWRVAHVRAHTKTEAQKRLRSATLARRRQSGPQSLSFSFHFLLAARTNTSLTLCARQEKDKRKGNERQQSLGTKCLLFL